MIEDGKYRKRVRAMKGKIKIFGAILVVLAVIIVFIFYQNTKGPKAELLELKPQTIANTFQEEGGYCLK